MKAILCALALSFSIVGVCTAQTTPPDFTAPGVIAGIDRSSTFNLGPTGLRGWIYCNTWEGEYPTTGRMTDACRQILVTTATTPATNPDVNGNSLAVNDVILGAIAASSGTVPSFTSDARKVLGAAITNAEKTGAGTLRVKRWRAGTTTDVNITIPTLGEYSATAPYSCPKSAQILANTRNQMVGELIADPNYLDTTSDHANAINALALLASVQPGDPNYSTVQTRLQTFARSLSSKLPTIASGNWHPSYQLVFLAEYYLLTNDAQVVPTINAFTLYLVGSQSMWGTYGHVSSVLYKDGSGRRISNGYGPVNAVGNIANLAIVLGKKALQAAIVNGHFSQPIDPEIDVAIARATGFLGSYVNKGSIPYGEHRTGADGHGSNGKDASAAVFFGLQADKAVQTEYFSRMSIASWVGVDAGHTGQVLGMLWAALGAGMGGEAAASGHFKQLLWRYDIQRRTNGSFTYDNYGNDYYSGGTTSDGTYLGGSAGSDVKGTAIYLLTYSLPLKLLHITGKQANPAYTLDSTKVANSVSAGVFRLDRTSLSIPQLFTAFGEYDPVVRYYASVELAARAPTGPDLTTLRGLLTNADPNIRKSAAEALGIRKDTTALPTLVGMLNDPDHWVRQKAAAAIYKYPASTVSPHRDALINAFLANAPADPDVTDWTDPMRFSLSELSQVLFDQLADSTINAPKTTHLYPALRVGLLLPTGAFRGTVAAFARKRLNLTHLQAVYPELAEVASFDTPADRMFSPNCRINAMAFMAENKIIEGIPIALFTIQTAREEFSEGYVSEALRALVSYGDAARYTLPSLREIRDDWQAIPWYATPGGAHYFAEMNDTITFLENAVSAPVTNLGKCVANSQIVTTTGAKAITLTGVSPLGAFSFLKLTNPANGTLTGTAPNFTYTPNVGFTGTDKFTFQIQDSITTSDPATASIIVGSSGNGIVGAYFDNADFTTPVLTRTDAQINFDWGTGSPDTSIGADSFSTRWSGYLLAPETGTYTLSGLTSDGFRAYLNGVTVINNLNDQSTRWTDGQSITLTAGQKVPLLLEYYENTGSAVAKLKWTGPSFAGLNGTIIPQAYLFDSNSNGGPDTTAPVISTLNPAANATGVAHTADLVATFSENIVRGTGNITLKNLSDGTQTLIPVTDTAQIAISGATLIINPTALLVGSKNYAVRIAATAIDDTAGLSFAGITNDTTWNFTTTAPDTAKPTPNPMTFALPPQTGGSASITMTATTASDPSGVEYRFNNVTLGTSSPWQSSPTYTATGLAPSSNYTFTVQVRDKSAAGNTTTASAQASARTLGSGPLDLMSLNFYDYGPFAPADYQTLTLEAGESAGVGAFHVNGWQNYQVPWGLGSPAAPITLTSNVGSTATFRLNDALHGGPYNGGSYDSAPHVFFVGGDGDLMDGHANGVESLSERFNMDVSNIPYPSYDLIVYLGANKWNFGDGTGKIVLNGGATQSFTLRPGQFNGFIEITNATTPGNYIVFRGLTSPSVNLKVWGNGSNHIGPCGFQIVNYGAVTGDTLPPVISTYSPADNAASMAVAGNLVATFSEAIAIGAGNITIKNLTDATQTTIAVTDTTQVSISGAVLTINPTTNLLIGKNYAVQIATAAVKDLSNNAFAGITNDTTWNFATANSVPISPPVTAGMVVWLPADGVDTNDSNQVRVQGGDTFVTQWKDWSSNSKHATNTTLNDQPRYIASGLNDKPVLRFAQDDNDYGDRLYLGDLSANFPTGASVFVVATIDNDGRYNLFGNRNNNDERWVADTWGESRPGSFRQERSSASSFTQSDWPTTGSHVFALKSGSTEFEVLIDGAPIGTDSASYNSGAGSNWTIGNRSTAGQQLQGDIAEVILYNRVLTPAEAQQVGGYLAQKYGVATTDLPPTISTLSPADNAPGVAVTANLVATFSEAIALGSGNITIKNLTDSTQTVITLPNAQVTATNAVLTINPTANLLNSKNYAVQIDATAVKDLANNAFAGIANNTTWNFATPDTVPPTISTFSPADNAASVAAAVNLVATFSEAIAIGTGNITIKNLTDATQTVITLPNAKVTAAGAVLTINPAGDLLGGKNYAIQIDATAIKDTSNNAFAGIANDTTWNFATAETIPPTIFTYSPANNATGVAVTSNIVATFSEAIANGTGNITLKNLTDATQTTIDVTDTTQVSISGTVLTINPTTNLLNGKNYAVQIDAMAVQDLANNAFAGIANDTTWNFATPDIIPPTISTYSPAANATAVALTSNLVATFNESIAIGAGNITIKNLTDATQTTIAVTDTTQVSISGTVLTINPATNLVKGKNYAIQIAATAVKDLANNAFAGITSDTTWYFATPETIPPTISTFSPANNAAAVAVTENLVATFSEAIAIGTGNITLKNLTDATETTIDVTDTTQVSISGAVLTINPSANLLGVKNYAIQIAATAVKDLANNAFAGIANDTTWNFTSAVIPFVWTQATGGAQAWDTGTNWQGGLVPSPITGDAIDFSTVNIAADTTLTLGADRTAWLWKFGDSSGAQNWIVSAGNQMILAGTTPTIEVKQNTTTLNNVVAGSSGLLKTGAGTLTLSGSNTYTGGLVLNAGTVAVTTASLNNNAITVNGTATLTATSSTTTSGGLNLNADSILSSGNNNTALTVNGVVTGSGTLAGKNGAGVVTVNLLNSGNDFSGAIFIGPTTVSNINAQILTVNSIGDSSATPITFGYGNTTGTANEQTFAYTGSSALTLSNRYFEFGPINTAAANGSGTIAASGATSADTLTIIKDLVVSGTGGGFTKNLTLKGSNTGNNTFAGKIADGVGTPIRVTKADAGRWILSGTNTYTGATTLTGGTLSVGASNNLGAAANSLVFNGGTLRITGTALTNFSGIGHAVSFTPAKAVGLDIDDASHTFTADQILNQTTGALTKAGAGTLVLDKVNTYTGATTISGGTLRVNSPGSLASASAVAVNGTSTLGGNGTINGTVTVAATASLAPGASVGTLTIGGGLNISALANNGAGKLRFELGPIATSDKITVGGALTIGTAYLGFSDFDFSSLAGLQNGTYTLISYNTLSGTLAASGRSGAIGTGGNGTLQLNTVSKSLELVVTGVVSNPYATWAVGGVAFDADTNNDGVDNGMAWLLGATHSSENAVGKLPASTSNGTHLRLTFRCLKSTMRGGAVLKLQCSNDLGLADPWTTHEAAVPDADGTVNGVTFDTTADADPAFINVIADIPATGSKIFARLSAVVTP